MKAKKVYEFIQKKSLKKSIQNDIGIRAKYKKEIEQWFSKYAPDINYNIDEEKMETMVHNYLSLNKCECKYIPDGLKIMFNSMVGYAININRSKVIKIGKNLTIFGGINAAYSNLEEYPENISIKINGHPSNSTLMFTHTQIKELPENLIIPISLDISFTPIKELPDNLTIMGNLYIDHTEIKELPRNLKIGNNDEMSYIYVSKENLKYFESTYGHKYKFKFMN